MAPPGRAPSARAAGKRRREEEAEAAREAAADQAAAAAAAAGTVAAAPTAAADDDVEPGDAPEREWLGAAFLRDAERCDPPAGLPPRATAAPLGPTAVPRTKQAPRAPRAETTWVTQPAEKAKAPKTLVLPAWEAAEVRAPHIAGRGVLRCTQTALQPRLRGQRCAGGAPGAQRSSAWPSGAPAARPLRAPATAWRCSRAALAGAMAQQRAAQPARCFLRASQASAADKDFAQRIRAYETTLGKSTANGYYTCLHNLRGFVDYKLPREEYALLDADVRAHKKITAALADRFVAWLNSAKAPPSQFKKYMNALVWGQKARACWRVWTALTPLRSQALNCGMGGGAIPDPVRDSDLVKMQKRAASTRAAQELRSNCEDTCACLAPCARSAPHVTPATRSPSAGVYGQLARTTLRTMKSMIRSRLS